MPEDEARLLKNFLIRNFRGFQNLEIPRLGRVNLIVGKNSVGKSSVLEAIRIYAANGLPEALWEAVTNRDEHRLGTIGSEAVLGLFNDASSITDSMVIGPDGDRIEISVQFRRAAPGDDGAMRYTLIENPAYDDVAGARVDVLVRSDLGNNMFPLLRDSGPLMSRSIRLRRDAVRAEALPRFPHVLVGTNGLTLERQAELWDQVTLSSRELDVINSLRLIAPNLDRINLVGSKDDRERSPVVKLSTNDGPVPLRRLGDGVTRVFGMALALVNSKGGILLIDEIENGIHYSVQESLWRFILDVSRRLNVQVFATSHSWDCVKAFQRATAACQAEEGILTRLEMVGRNVVASQFDEDDLAVATRELIEIR